MKCLERVAASHDLIVTMEENVLSGGFGEACADALKVRGSRARMLHVGVPDVYVEHGSVAQLKKTLGMDADSVTARILEALNEAQAGGEA